VAVVQEIKLGIVAGFWATVGSSLATNSTFWMAAAALTPGFAVPPQVVQSGAAAARAPSWAARVIVPYMLKACPNQKIPSSIMNINGITAAASAISVARSSQTSRLKIEIDRGVLRILSHPPQFPENSIKHHSAGQRDPVGDFQRVGIIE